jgi:ABC-type multidrug transport system permease subunit
MGIVVDIKLAVSRMAITGTRILLIDIIFMLFCLLLAFFNLLVLHNGFDINISFYPEFDSFWNFICLLCPITASISVVILLANGLIESIDNYFKTI